MVQYVVCGLRGPHYSGSVWPAVRLCCTEDGVLDNRDTDIIDISEEIKEKPQKKTEEQDTSVKQFRQRKKHGWIKWVVIGVIVAAIGGFIVYKVVDAKNKLAEALDANNSTTAEITRMDLSKAISSTGTIRSKDI